MMTSAWEPSTRGDRGSVAKHEWKGFGKHGVRPLLPPFPSLSLSPLPSFCPARQADSTPPRPLAQMTIEDVLERERMDATTSF